MPFHPGSDRICEETLELFGLANALFVSNDKQGHLAPHPYLARGLKENAEKLIIEKLLAVAIKLRFLDDHTSLIKASDRSNAGILVVDSVETGLGLREALNKIIHHRSIQVFAQPSNTTIINVKTSPRENEILIPEGSYPGFSIFVHAQGTQGNKDWSFHTELIHLSNEILRILHLDNSRDEDSAKKA